MKYVLGPYIWNAGEISWELPIGAISSIDLRSIQDMGQESVGQNNVAIFVANDNAVFSNDYLDFGGGKLDEILLAANQRNKAADMMGVRQSDLPNDANLSDIIWDRLTLLSDPEGASGPPPLIPTTNRFWQVTLGDQIIFKKFNINAPEFAKLQEVQKKTYKKLHDGGVDYQKWMGAQIRKYGLIGDSYELFIPSDLPKEKPKRPTTTLTDDFNRSDESLSAGNWSELIGIWEVISNQCTITSDGGDNVARFNTDLSSDDHYSQATIVDHSTQQGVMCRKDDTATLTYYFVISTPIAVAVALYKRVFGTATQLNIVGATIEDGDIYKLECNGSIIRFYLNNILLLGATDSSISGNLRCGLYTPNNNVTYDNFEASDELTPFLLSSYYYRKRRNYSGV